MKRSKRSMITATAILLALAMGGATVSAQGGKPAEKKAKAEHKMDMSGMKEMMGNPHHVLAMAYRDNLATFARALRGQANQDKSVNLDLARPAVAEMRRSYDQIRQHHSAAMASMGAQAATPTPAPMQNLESHLTALGEHLTALEAEVNRATPDAAKVAEHSTEIVKECGGMGGMGNTGKMGSAKKPN